ncbi:GTP-binding protein rbg1 [Vanrija albida]|uniref:GTP-binding protein rbg1 n=1 Tax=Vanrija albida TaxID=181172 RepID=A0ABR3Q1S8_9TREE
MPTFSVPKDGPQCAPDPLRAARIVSFVAAVFVGLASGSNYVYSGYAPQLTSKLGITSTQANLVGLGGNLGVYLTGPIWGKVVDARGPRIPLIFGAVLNLLGYSFVRLFYIGFFPIRDEVTGETSHLQLFFLTLSMFLTGVAGSAGLSAGINATARSFPDRTRASATGAVLAGFGLSAFLFSTLGHAIFHGEAGGLLLLLAIGTATPDIIGSILVRPYPPVDYEEALVFHEEEEEELLDPEEAENTLARTVSLSEGFGVTPDFTERAVRRSLEMSHSGHLDPEEGRGRPNEPLLPRARLDSSASLPPTAISYTPLQVWRSTDFHILFAVLALLCGVGLEWINNVGAVTLALARDGWSYDARAVAALQAKQVATISLLNCAGRIVAGAVSDLCKARFGVKRVWFLPIVAVMFLGSQLAVLRTTDVKSLWLVSAALGLSYGSLFNVLPMLVLEWFGMAHFSQNFGWMNLGPAIGGNVFNVVFGRVYDSNTVGRVGGPEPPTTPEVASSVGVGHAAAFVQDISERLLAAPPGPDRKHECLLGRGCYSTAFRVSVVACLVALALSVVAGIRRERLSVERKRTLRAERAAVLGRDE